MGESSKFSKSIQISTTFIQNINDFKFNNLYTRNLKMDTLANNEDLDEMQFNAAFHQDLHCLQRHDQSLAKEKKLGEIITCDSSIYIMAFLTILHKILGKIPMV